MLQLRTKWREASVTVAAAATVLGGCAAVTTTEGERLRMTSPELRDYVERVFRLQNRVATDLAFALEEDEVRGFDPPAALVAAEQALLTACAGLNELAARRRDGERVGPGRGLAAAREAPECEAAALRGAAALER